MTERLRRNRHESGFTLIELMVVVLVLGILMAIAIPTFLGARSRSQDKQPQVSLRIELTAAKIAYTDTAAYGAVATNLCASALTASEPAVECLHSVTGSLALQNPSVKGTVTPFREAAKRVSVHVLNTDVVGMASLSKTGTCYLLRTNELTGQVWYAKLTPAGTNYCSGYFAATSATVTAVSSW